MNKFWNTTALASALLFSGHAIAQDNLADDFYAHWFMGLNLGSTSVGSNTGAQNFKFITAGVSFGYQFSENFNSELLLIVPVAGKKDEFISDLLGTTVDAEYSSYGLFFNAKTSGNLYAKGRIGLASSQFSYSADDYTEEKNSDIGLAYGIGGGYGKGQYSYELEYIVMPDVDDPLFQDESYSAKTITATIAFRF